MFFVAFRVVIMSVFRLSDLKAWNIVKLKGKKEADKKWENDEMYFI